MACSIASTTGGFEAARVTDEALRPHQGAAEQGATVSLLQSHTKVFRARYFQPVLQAGRRILHEGRTVRQLRETGSA